jgi:hypothetical protein
VYKYVPASKDQTQSHLHSRQVNAKPTGNSIRELPASQAGSQNVHKEGVRVSNVLPHTTGDSSLHHRLVSSGPFQGQQQLACVRVTTAENSGVSARVSRTFDIPHFIKVMYNLKKLKHCNQIKYKFALNPMASCLNINTAYYVIRFKSPSILVGGIVTSKK